MTPQPTRATLPQGTHIGRTALRVNDLEGVTQFYRDIVGLVVLRHSDRRSILGAGETPLLVLQDDPDALERQATSAGLFHTAFRVPTRRALGAALSRLRTHWQLSGASDHWVSEALYTTDPEGNGVEIYWDRPREDWPMTADGRVRLGTEPLDLESLTASGTAKAQVPIGTDIGHVHLEVSSLESFTDCYVDTIGFEVQTGLPRAVFVSAGGYHHHIGANTWGKRTEPRSGRGLAWFEIVVPGTEPVEALRDRLAVSRFASSGTEEGLTITDTDGIESRFRVER